MPFAYVFLIHVLKKLIVPQVGMALGQSLCDIQYLCWQGWVRHYEECDKASNIWDYK
jgi:hypothetical protein